MDVVLEAGVEYIFTYNVKMPKGTGQRVIHVGHNSTQSLDGVTELASYPVLTDTYTQLPFLPHSTKFTVAYYRHLQYGGLELWRRL